MPAMPVGDGQSPMPLDAHTNRDAVPELVQLFQAQSASSANSQSSGARDIFKAGHRRLRQLALRQRKPTDPRSKAEEASRQLLALQEEGFLPAPKAKKPLPPKTSIDSTLSSSRSATNLSVRSDSRRDVERIGQPWLGDPLERAHSHEPNGTQLSSLDLRDLTSLVQSAVSFPPQLEDSIPPPYQPSPQPTTIPVPATSTPEKSLLTNTPSQHAEDDKQVQDQNGVPSTSPNSADKSASCDRSVSGPPQPEDKKPEAAQVPESQSTSDIQATSHGPSNPACQTLKLFPDTLPPRVSSKAAWRISNGRPVPNRLITESLQSPTSGSMQTGSLGSRGAYDRLKSQNPGHPITEGKEMTVTPTSGNRSLTHSPIFQRFPQHRNPRRPSSLPLGAINSFPLPAPMRPLPSLPEPVPDINAKRGQALPVNWKPTEEKQTPTLQPSHSSPEVCSTIKPDIEDTKSTATAATNTEPRQPSLDESYKKDETTQSGITPFVRNGPTRAERVHALKMKDLSANRFSGNGDRFKGGLDLPLRSPRIQTIPERIDEVSTSKANDGDGKDSEGQHANKNTNGIVSSALSPPALNLQPRPANQPATGKRSSSSPMQFKAPSEASNRSSLSTSNRSSGLSRSSSARSSNVSRDRNDGQDIYSRSETPLPSSDDECMGRNKYEYQHQPSPPKKRRLKPAPIVVGDGNVPKKRYGKKQSSRSFPIPTTPQRRSRGLERMSPQSQQSQSTFYSQDTRGSRHYQSAYVHSLEGRIAHLERQNKILQAALLAALDLGAKPSLETLLGGSASSLSPPDTGRSFSSVTHASSFDERPARHDRQARNKPRPPHQSETWIASPGSSRRSSYSADSEEHVRELEEMMEDFDFGWMSDKSSLDRVQRPGIRA
ncbi:hypothetical protein BJX96DRAFT_177912 [Aspergillus floccosus]